MTTATSAVCISSTSEKPPTDNVEIRLKWKEAFESIDVEKNGTINCLEIKKLFDQLGWDSSSKSIEKCFSFLDKSQNEYINFEEFLKWGTHSCKDQVLSKSKPLDTGNMPKDQQDEKIQTLKNKFPTSSSVDGISKDYGSTFVYSGMLKKRFRDISKTYNYHARYFVLGTDSLDWYVNNTLKEKKGSFSLTSIVSVKDGETQHDIDHNIFSIITGKKEYRLMAPSSSEKCKWILLLKPKTKTAANNSSLDKETQDLIDIYLTRNHSISWIAKLLKCDEKLVQTYVTGKQKERMKKTKSSKAPGIGILTKANSSSASTQIPSMEGKWQIKKTFTSTIDICRHGTTVTGSGYHGARINGSVTDKLLTFTQSSGIKTNDLKFKCRMLPNQQAKGEWHMPASNLNGIFLMSRLEPLTAEMSIPPSGSLEDITKAVTMSVNMAKRVIGRSRQHAWAGTAKSDATNKKKSCYPGEDPPWFSPKTKSIRNMKRRTKKSSDFESPIKNVKSSDPIDLDSFTPEDIKKIILLQKVIKHWYAIIKWRQTYKAFKDTAEGKKIITKNRILQEIQETEGAYVAALRIGVESKLSLSDIEKQWSSNKRRIHAATFARLAGSADIIFGNMEELFSVHEIFYKELTKQLNEYPTTQLQLGILFQNLCTRMKPYNLYVRRYNAGLNRAKILNEEAVHKVVRIPIVERLHGKEQWYRELTDILIRPIQRIPRYKLLLEQLIKRTPNTHSDFEHLTQALFSVSHMAETINEYQRKAEGKIRAGEIEKYILNKKFSIMPILRSGWLRVYETQKWKRRYFVLHGDELLWYREISPEKVQPDGVFDLHNVVCQTIKPKVERKNIKNTVKNMFPRKKRKSRSKSVEKKKEKPGLFTQSTRTLLRKSSIKKSSIRHENIKYKFEITGTELNKTMIDRRHTICGGAPINGGKNLPSRPTSQKKEKLILAGDTHVDSHAWMKMIQSSANINSLDVYTKLSSSHRYVIKEGNLEVIRQGPLVFETAIYVPQYCVLFNDLILYFQEKSNLDRGMVVEGIIHLASVQTIKKGDNDGFYDYCITTSTGGGGGELYTCYASTEREMDNWIQSMEQALSQFRSILKVGNSSMNLTLEGVNKQLKTITGKLSDAEREAELIRRQLNELTACFLSLAKKREEIEDCSAQNQNFELCLLDLIKHQEEVEKEMDITLQKSLETSSKVAELMSIQDEWTSIRESLVYNTS